MVASSYLEVTHSNTLLASHFVVGMPTGAIGGSGMMAIRAISPRLANKIVGMADGFVDGLTESRVAKALKLLFGKDVT